MEMDSKAIAVEFTLASRNDRNAFLITVYTLYRWYICGEGYLRFQHDTLYIHV